MLNWHVRTVLIRNLRQSSTVPGELEHVEFMIKSIEKYPTTQDWKFAYWLAMQQKPFGKNASFAQECFNCHIQGKDTNYAFTRITHTLALMT